MNKVYKTVLNRLTGEAVVTSELARGKTKSVSKGMALTAFAVLCCSSQSTFALSVDAISNDVAVVDGSSHLAQPGSGIVWRVAGNYSITGNNDITITLVDSGNRAIYAYGNGKVIIGDNLSVINDYTANPAIRSLGISAIQNSEIVIGDNLKITLTDNSRGDSGENNQLSRAISTGETAKVSIGNNAILEGNQAAIVSAGNQAGTSGLSSVTIGDNAIINGTVAMQYNSAFSLGAGSQITNKFGDMGGIITLLGKGASGVIKDSTLTLSNIKPDSYNANNLNSVIYLAHLSQGVLSSDAQTGEYTQYFFLDGGKIYIGDSASGAVKGNLIGAELFNYDTNTPDPDSGHAYVHLKDVEIESAGGNLIRIENKTRLETPGTSPGNNKVTLILDNVDGTSQDEGIYLADSGTSKGEVNIDLINGSKAVGGITNDSAGDLNFNIDSGSIVDGDVVNNDTGNITGNITNGGTVNGDVINNGTGDLDISVGNGGSLNGDVIHNGSGNTDINVNEGGSWIGTGKGVGLWVKTNSTYQAVNESATFTSITMDHNATIDFGSPITSRLSRSTTPTSFKTLHTSGDMTQTGGTGNITMSTNLGLGKGDLIAADGSITGTYVVNVTNYGGEPATSNESLRIIQGGSGTNAAVALTGNQYRDAGMYRYYLEKDASGNSYWLVNGDGTGTSHGGGDDDTSNSGNAYNPDGSFDKFVPDANFVPKLQQMSDLAYILEGSASAQTIIMLNQSANVTKHMNEVRLTGKHDSGIWLNNYYTNTRVDKEVMGNKFTINTNTTYLGADKVWNLENGSTVIAGVFAGMGFSDNKYKLNGSKGDTDVYTGGAYGMWLHNSGLFADMTAQGYRVKTSDDAYTAEGAHTSYDVKSNAFSLGLDVGKRFDLSNGIYLEPALKLSYLHNGGDTFDTKGASTINVKKTSTDIFQYGAGLNIGKTITTSVTNAFVQPYFSVTALKQEVSGGDIQSGDAKIKSKLDGYQVQSNLGINWQINKNNGVFTEVNASAGDKYNNAFGIAAGYRYSF